MTVKKLTVENLRIMVKEAVAVQMEQAALERKQKIEADKAKKEKTVKESKVVKVTAEQLKRLVKEAVEAKLKENMGMMGPEIGDLVSFNGKTGYVADVKPDGTVAITRDGVKMSWVPGDAVQVMASSDELDELSPEEMVSIDSGLDDGPLDPGEDPTSELGRIEGHLDSKLIGKPSRAALGKRADALKTQLGITDKVY